MFEVKEYINDIEDVKKIIIESYDRHADKTTQYYFLEGDNNLKLDELSDIDLVLSYISKGFNQLRVFSKDRELMVSTDKYLNLIDGTSQLIETYNIREINHEDYSNELKRVTKQYVNLPNKNEGYNELTLLNYIINGQISESIMYEVNIKGDK